MMKHIQQREGRGDVGLEGKAVTQHAVNVRPASSAQVCTRLRLHSGRARDVIEHRIAIRIMLRLRESSLSPSQFQLLLTFKQVFKPPWLGAKILVWRANMSPKLRSGVPGPAWVVEDRTRQSD